MRQAPKRGVLRYEMRESTMPNWPPARCAILECGHIIAAPGTLEPKRKACWECAHQPSPQDSEGER